MRLRRSSWISCFATLVLLVIAASRPTMVSAGYQVDELPPPVDADYSFAAYHSKTEFSSTYRV
jgi:hypothetical protein